MDGSMVLDVVLGLSYLYLVMSLLASVVVEWVAQLLDLRGKVLIQGVAHLLEGSGGGASALSHRVLCHSLVRQLADPGPRSRPSYIPARTFSSALLDVLAGSQAVEVAREAHARAKAAALEHPSDPARQEALGAATTLLEAVTLGAQAGEGFARLEGTVKGLPTGDLKDSLLVFLDEVRGSAGEGQEALEALRHRLESWYDATMDRVTGWYKRKAQWILLTVAAAGVLAFNADSVVVAEYLMKNPEARAQVLLQAGALATSPPGVRDPSTSGKAPSSLEKTSVELGNLLESLENPSLPLGWACAESRPGCAPHGLPAKLAGLLVTLLAVSLGAPFWFQAVNTLLNLRGTGKRPTPGQR